MQDSVPGHVQRTQKNLLKIPATYSRARAQRIGRAGSGAGASAGPGAAGPDDITVSLKGVVATLPDPLKKKLDRSLTGSEVIWIRKDHAVRQLASGSVKLPFSEVMRMAPNYFLTPDKELLGTMVSLPLQEILPKIKALPRRTTQKQVEVPQDLAPVFGPGKENVKPVSAPASTAPAAAAPTPAPAPTQPSPAPTPAPARPLATEKPLSIPQPTTKPLPPPSAPPVPKPTVQPAEGYAPPAAKPLETQAPITFKLPGQDAPAPAAAPAPEPVHPSVAPTPTAKPAAPPTPAPAPAAADGPVIAFGDIFGQPDKKDWSPQEIVERTSTLRGVAGALITTIDGLPVAFHLPANLSGNAVAAFVPQMYTRIIQYTRDLKLGEAKHLTIIIESVPLQIFKAGGVYFTALGRANENLPKPQLTAIASALSRQSPS